MTKLRKITGYICILIGIAILVLGIWGHTLQKGSDNIYTEASAENKLISSHKTASAKTAPSTVKKAASAVSAVETANKDTQKSLDNVSAFLSACENGTVDDALLNTVLGVEDDLKETEDAALRDAAAELENASDSYVLSYAKKEYDAAYKSVSSALDKLNTAVKGIVSVWEQSGIQVEDITLPTVKNEKYETAEEYKNAISELVSFAENLSGQAASVQNLAEKAQMDADNVVSSDTVSFSHKFGLLVGSYPIGFVFTAVLLLVIGFILAFQFEHFMKLWKKYPLFSTFIALIVMVVIQVYALGFKFDTYGQWAGYWLKNFLNVLRSNSSVGMIALGMTFVIITGGIDLAVGSNLAGVATVVMVLLDTSSKGVLTGAGVTGTPNFIIAIAGGLLTGAILGCLTGLGITRGKVPPFIITLGIMNIVRSVAQYFTKSYKPEVPKAFQVIANTEVIGGQMLLPIIYWLILAVIMYIVSKHTAFGKHIYAVGSNERASRLSGINVDAVKMKVYILMGVIVAIAAITSVARLRGVDVASAGTGFEMNAIAAVVVGGTSMAGGRGSILGTVFGVLIIGIMDNLLVLLGIDAFLADAFTGAIIIFAVLIQRKDN